MAKITTEVLLKKNGERWKNVVPTIDYSQAAKKLLNQKNRYKTVEEQTGVPWFVIAVIHYRESSQNFLKQLAQGDPLSHVSTHIPKGRGPFETWEDGAYDALVNCPPYVSQWKDWTAAGTMTLLELFNGLGYANKGVPSAYVWAGTNQYRGGKYVADGVWDSNAVDKQPGCASLLIAMRAKDNTILFADEKPVISDEDKPLVPPKVPTETKAAGSVAASIGAAMLAFWEFVKAHWIELSIGAAAITGLVYFMVKSYKKRKAQKNVEEAVSVAKKTVE